MFFQLVARSYGRWFEEQITDLGCKLWTQRADYIVEASLLRDDASCNELHFDMRKPDFGSAGHNGGSLMLTALLRREIVAEGEAVEVAAVPAEAVELVVAAVEAVDMMN